jgi:hypothetical protein
MPVESAPDEVSKGVNRWREYAFLNRGNAWDEAKLANFVDHPRESLYQGFSPRAVQ